MSLITKKGTRRPSRRFFLYAYKARCTSTRLKGVLQSDRATITCYP